MITKLFLVIWLVFAGVGIFSYLANLTRAPWILGLGTVVCVAVFYIVLKEKLRRKKEGYYVYKRGGSEDGILFYNEGNRVLQLYFDRLSDIIYIPSDPLWKENMPAWALDRKGEIVSRVKQRVGKRIIGKSWTFQETDNRDRIVSRDLQDDNS